MSQLITTDKILVKIRSCLDKDIRSLINIDNGLKVCWEDSDFKKFKRGMDNVSLIADIGDTPVGYILLTLSKTRATIVRLVVTQDLRRRSIGTQLVERARLGYLKKDRICLSTEIDEYNIAAQMFLRANSFRANEIINEYGSDTYIFEYFKI